MGGYMPHPDIDATLKRFRATGPIWGTEEFERELIGLAYMRLRWQVLAAGMYPNELQELEDHIDRRIGADAQQQEITE